MVTAQRHKRYTKGIRRCVEVCKQLQKKKGKYYKKWKNNTLNALKKQPM